MATRRWRFCGQPGTLLSDETQRLQAGAWPCRGVARQGVAREGVAREAVAL